MEKTCGNLLLRKDFFPKNFDNQFHLIIVRMLRSLLITSLPMSILRNK